MSLASQTPVEEQAVRAAQERRDVHVREIIEWHFSEETGSPFWRDWAKRAGWNPLDKIHSFADLTKFPHFEGEWLRDEPNERWVPRAYQGRPYFIFETGGTTGMPKQRIGWEDHHYDYEEFSERLDDRYFPKGATWLMVGPTGGGRLRIAIEHLAQYRGGTCHHVSVDARWVKSVLAQKQVDVAKQYMNHIVEQTATILRNRRVQCMFIPPRLLEALDEKINLPDAGVTGVFSGGTSMTKQMVRFLVEEVLGNEAQFVPTYGNTLMGLACSRPVSAETNFDLTYHAPEPRAVLRVVDPNDTTRTVEYGEWGRVELTTLTKEFFMPRFLERDEAVRREPWGRFAWDGVGEVRPFGQLETKAIEGVY